MTPCSFLLPHTDSYFKTYIRYLRKSLHCVKLKQFVFSEYAIKSKNRINENNDKNIPCSCSFLLPFCILTVFRKKLKILKPSNYLLWFFVIVFTDKYTLCGIAIGCHPLCAKARKSYHAKPDRFGKNARFFGFVRKQNFVQNVL